MQQTIIKKGKTVIIDGQPFSAKGYPIRPFFPTKYPPRLKYRACGEEINYGEDDEMRRSYSSSQKICNTASEIDTAQEPSIGGHGLQL